MSFPVYTVLVIAISVVLTHVFNASSGGLLPVVAVHTSVNVAAGVAAQALGESRELDQTLAMIALALAVLVFTRGRLRFPRAASISTPSGEHHEHR